MQSPAAHYLKAARGRDGRYRLFFVGTAKEVFPGRWFSTAAAARRYAAARAALETACRQVGADPAVDIDNFETLTTDQLRDEVSYLADFQG